MGKPNKNQPKLHFEQQRKAVESGAEAPEHSQVKTTAPGSDTTVDFHSMFTTIQSTLSNIDSKIDSLTYRVDRMSERLDKYTECIDMAERSISEAEDTQHQLELKQTKADKTLQSLMAKTEDLEGRSRRCNLRLMGVAETTRTGNMEQYIETLLIALLGRETFSDVFIIERAHRFLTPPPAVGVRPRPITAKILNYRDRDAALRKARELGTLNHGGMSISIYPDFTSQEARKKFLDVKKKLRENNISYAMIYPARLKITDDGKSIICNNPKDVIKFLQLKHPHVLRRRSPRGAHAEQDHTSDVE